MHPDEAVPYASVDEMVAESAAWLQKQRDADDRDGWSWVRPAEVAFHTGLDEHVVLGAMIRLAERVAEVTPAAET